MAAVYNTVYTIDSCPSLSTFTPCCNTSISIDYQPRVFQEIYYAPEPAPQIQYVRQRLPDPPPDVIDRVVIVPQPKQYIYQIVEVPTKPPPVVRQRVVHQAPNQPLCGGTFHVRVPHNTPSPPGLIQSSSSIQSAPTVIQQAPVTVSSPPVISV